MKNRSDLRSTIRLRIAVPVALVSMAISPIAIIFEIIILFVLSVCSLLIPSFRHHVNGYLVGIAIGVMPYISLVVINVAT